MRSAGKLEGLVASPQPCANSLAQQIIETALDGRPSGGIIDHCPQPVACEGVAPHNSHLGLVLVVDLLEVHNDCRADLLDQDVVPLLRDILIEVDYLALESHLTFEPEAVCGLAKPCHIDPHIFLVHDLGAGAHEELPPVAIPGPRTALLSQ